MENAISNLITTYHELNASVIDQLDEEPSPLTFFRYVAKNRPFVVRQAATEWKAYNEWNAGYLRKKMEGESVKVAVTPLGNADAVVKQQDGSLVFVEPYETTEDFSSFLDYVQSSSTKGAGDTKNVKYAQTQNDNLHDEYANFLPDIPKDIPWARIALESHADAVNLWLGNDRSITSLHKDNYENIYVQIRGQKHFTLLPPCEMPCVNETFLPRGRYAPTAHPGRNEEEEGRLQVALENEASEKVPVAIWDPDVADQNTTRYSYLANPLRVTLEEGDMLYLPAMWYHKVSQTAGEEGFVCALNYWYDMDFSGHFWSGNNFVRDVVGEEGGQGSMGSSVGMSGKGAGEAREEK